MGQTLENLDRQTLKSHRATERGGRRLKGQPKVLPCVFTGSDVSATPQRLWPGAEWTVTAQGAKGKCLMYGVQQAAYPAMSPLLPNGGQGRLHTFRRP